MKTHEVYMIGLENLKAEFVRQFDGGKYRFSNGCLFDESGSSAKYVRANEEWDLVQEPVDFMTAINSGKRIRPEGHTLFYAAEEWCSKGLNHALINGKWYIASFGAEAR